MPLQMESAAAGVIDGAVALRVTPRGVAQLSQERPTRSQATLLGSHSVLIRERSRFTSAEAHFGHGGSGFVESVRYSSYLFAHAAQRNS